jgi:hypothetical protein
MPATTHKKIKQTRRPIKRRAMTASEKMRAHRARMRAKGFKLVQMWVPDTSRPGFAEEVRRQSLLVSGTPGELDAIEFLDAVSQDMDEWT